MLLAVKHKNCTMKTVVQWERNGKTVKLCPHWRL